MVLFGFLFSRMGVRSILSVVRRWLHTSHGFMGSVSPSSLVMWSVGDPTRNATWASTLNRTVSRLSAVICSEWVHIAIASSSGFMLPMSAQNMLRGVGTNPSGILSLSWARSVRGTKGLSWGVSSVGRGWKKAALALRFD